MTRPENHFSVNRLDRYESRFALLYPLQSWASILQRTVGISGVSNIFLATIYLMFAFVFKGGPQGVMTGFMHLLSAESGMIVAIIISAALFLLSFLIRNAMRLGGIVAILYGSILLFNFLSTPQVGPQTNTHTNILEEFIGGIIDGWDRFARAGYPLSGLTNLIYILLTLAFAFHVFWLLIRGGVEIVRTSKGERAIFGEPLQGLSLKSKILSRVFGLPPLLDFIRGSPGRYTLIVLLSAITAICMTGGPPFVLYMFVAATLAVSYNYDSCSSLDEFANHSRCGIADALELSLVGPLIGVLAMFVLVWLGRFARRLMRRKVRFSLEELQKVDGRAPVLFLRAFQDDQVVMVPPKLSFLGWLSEVGQRDMTLDEMLLEEATPYGPVVALGNPKDPRPPYGAARGYFEDRTWHEAVENLALNSSAVVLCLDETDSIRWEIGHLVKEHHVKKTLFLIPPKFSSAEGNARLMALFGEILELDKETMERLRTPTSRPGKGIVSASVLGVLYTKDGLLQEIRSSTFSRFAYLLTFRMFLREELNLKPNSKLEKTF